MARRPAPVQLTWAGYVGTTGLSAIDYLIADRFQVPVGWEKHYREKVLRMPDDYICYQPPVYAPPVGPLPALANGFVTFGSFNNTAKINSRVIALWGEIMRQVPRSRLILKYHWLDDVGLRQRMVKLFAAEGITGDRLEMQGTTMHGVQLQQYNKVDLGLDPFPYSGGLTTLEACWMGVPVVTCPGETYASRHSLSHMSNIGMTDTIAQDFDDYLAKAISLANDLPRLAELRAGLRPAHGSFPGVRTGPFHGPACCHLATDLARLVRSPEWNQVALDWASSPWGNLKEQTDAIEPASGTRKRCRLLRLHSHRHRFIFETQCELGCPGHGRGL